MKSLHARTLSGMVTTPDASNSHVQTVGAGRDMRDVCMSPVARMCDLDDVCRGCTCTMAHARAREP